jgi:hypothetical protein
MAGTSTNAPMPSADAAPTQWQALARMPLRIFRAPGTLAANRLGAKLEDDRMMIRTLIDMLFWNIVFVIGVAIVFTRIG